MLKDNFKSVGREAFGATEDEWNNFLIDCWDCMNMRVKDERGGAQYHYFDAATSELVVSDKPITVTITLK
jgi:hypothetical protein